MDFHYRILKNKDNELLFYSIRGCFDKHGEIGKRFLLEKIDVELGHDLKAEALFLLGTMECEMIKPTAISFLEHENTRDRYYAILILGWMGAYEDLSILNNKLINDENDELRGYAAISMREIWLNKKVIPEDILHYLYSAIMKEESIITLNLIIIAIQDLLKRKFGLTERLRDGVVTGDTIKAKQKIIKQLIL